MCYSKAGNDRERTAITGAPRSPKETPRQIADKLVAGKHEPPTKPKGKGKGEGKGKARQHQHEQPSGTDDDTHPSGNRDDVEMNEGIRLPCSK